MTATVQPPSSVKCSCGGTLVPTMLYQKIKDEDDVFEQTVRIEWKCETCGKVVKK